MIGKSCSNHLGFKNLSIRPENCLEFYQSQWQIGNSVNLLYVFYRILLALTFSTILAISVIDLDDINKSASLRAKWTIYLTNWHFSITTLQSVLSAYMVTSMYLHVRKNRERLSQSKDVNETLCSVYWALFTIAVNGTLFVSIIYWPMVYDAKVDSLSVVNIFTHAMNGILLLIDCFIVAHSVRILHFYLPLVFNMTYVGFTAIYYSLGGTNKRDEPYVYGILNWQKPKSTFTNVFFVLVCAMILHILVCFYVQLRKKLAKFLFKSENTHMNFPLNPLMEPLKKESPELEETSYYKV